MLVSLRKHDAASLSHLSRGPLFPHFAGPFVVMKKVANHAFQLELPKKALSAKVHDVFNVSQLKKLHSTTPRMDSLEDAQEQAQEWQEPPLWKLLTQEMRKKTSNKMILTAQFTRMYPSPNNTSRSPP